jgi:hypothetical protein
MVTKAQPKEFSIPADLLKTFHKELRFHPIDGSPYGYIMFDTKMLISILRTGDAKIRTQAAAELEGIMKTGANYVLMGQQANQMMK